MDHNFEQQPETRKAILMSLKQNGSETISSLRSKLNISSEGVRLQLVQLERDGYISRHTERKGSKGGRPATKIRLTAKGEALFPKQYHSLTVEVIDTISHLLGIDAVKKILAAMVDVRVTEWEGRLSGLSLPEKVTALKELYTTNDHFMGLEFDPETESIFLTEHNCPFYDVAMQRPVLCNVTLNTLIRLLGCQVNREQKFQKGDGCCVFRVQIKQPVELTTFLMEDEGL